MDRIIGMSFLALLAVIVSLLLSSFFLISSDLLYDDVVAEYRTKNSFFYPLPSGAFAHIRDDGNRDGPVLVLLHGANASTDHWDGWIEELGDRYRMISFDLPGHGLTGAVPNDDYSRLGMAKFVDEILQLMNIDKAVLVGNSMGGAVALQYALNHPKKVNALILIAASGMKRDADDGSVGAFRLTGSPLALSAMRYITPRFMVGSTLRAVVGDEQVISDAMIDRHWKMLRMTGSREASIKRFQLSATRVPLEPQLGQITAPTLLMWGYLDPLVPLKYGVRMNTAIFGSKLVGYGALGHLPMLEDPKTTAADAAAFLSLTLN